MCVCVWDQFSSAESQLGEVGTLLSAFQIHQPPGSFRELGEKGMGAQRGRLHSEQTGRGRSREHPRPGHGVTAGYRGAQSQALVNPLRCH